MSRSCCTVAPSKEVPDSSGRTRVTGADGSSIPRATRIPATAGTIDFATDITIRAGGSSARWCGNPQGLNGGSCQFASVTPRWCGKGGEPRIRPSSAAVGYPDVVVTIDPPGLGDGRAITEPDGARERRGRGNDARAGAR